MIDLDVLCDKVTNTQNKAKSLKWGVHIEPEEHSAMFAVGHKSYKGKVLYIHLIVRESVEVTYFIGEDRKPTHVEMCSSEEEVLKEVRRILTFEFPAVS